MKLMFASDIHGSAYYAEKLARAYREEKAERLILLGDLLYHGPRNDLPRGYDPKAVIEILNGLKQDILAVRGNCDSEVDQMVLDFPMMADYGFLYLKGRTVYLTHGHVLSSENLPKLKEGDLLIHGHTHIAAMQELGACVYLNPGSAAIPKDELGPSYMVYQNGTFEIKRIENDGKWRYKI